MIEIIDSGATLANCYFCDNDIIAIGVIKALKARGYRIPEDVSIIGFDNINESRIVDPSLTTIDVSRHFMAETATRQLLFRTQNKASVPVKIAITPTLIKRFSV